MHDCFCRLCSNMWTRIQQLGLQEGYINDLELDGHLRMICALPFVPANNVQKSFDKLPALIRNQYGNGGNEVLGNFKENYGGRFCFNTLKGIPTFPINF